MFGFSIPFKPELKIKEYELFRACYCGVCKSISKRLGQLPRLTLTYDATFLAILLTGLSDKTIHIQKERCLVHPIKQRPSIKAMSAVDLKDRSTYSVCNLNK